MNATIRFLFVFILTASIAACGGNGGDDGSGMTPQPVQLPPAQNQAPTANAGVDQSADEGTIVNLAGTGADGDGTIASYSWQQDSGTIVVLTDADMATASFIAPMVSASEDLIFRLTVTDNGGASASDTVTVTALNVNFAPVANAGAAQSVNTGLPVTLDGRASFDADGDALTYSWSLSSIPAGSVATLSAATTALPTFTPDVDGNYVAELIVNDGTATSIPSSVTISATTPPMPPAEPIVNVDAETKKLVFSWANVDGADYYRLMENADGHSGFTQVGNDIAAGTLSVSRDIAVHLFDFVNGQYIIEACNVSGCTSSDVVTATDVMRDTIGYFKASNTGGVGEFTDFFGAAVALSADGSTLAVGAPHEESSATGINGDQNNDLTAFAGAVYLFRFDGTIWIQEAYIKASNTGVSDNFGTNVALSANGNTLAVGAIGEQSNATGINGDQDDNSLGEAGAVYLFRFDGTNWFQDAYIKASNTEQGDRFGRDVALSSDGNTLAVGALWEDSNATGINGDQSDNSAGQSGAVYVFRSGGAGWFQEAYIKASNTGSAGIDGGDNFGENVTLSADGNTLAVGAPFEWSSATGINGDQTDNSSLQSGAAYLFRFDGIAWLQQAYIKASNTGVSDTFGGNLALSANGNTLAVGAALEESGATGINGDQSDNSLGEAGAVYLFRFDGTNWLQEAYIKASNAGVSDRFGSDVALSADGNTLAVGASSEDSIATGINGDQNDDSTVNAGAVYLFNFDGTDWYQQAYVKAPNTGQRDGFGVVLVLSNDGNTLAVGARSERSSATGVNGDQNDNSDPNAGAAYIY